MNARRWHRARYVVLLVIPIALAGCDVFGTSEQFFAEDRTYEHRFFETDEACLAAQPDPNFFINCSQWVDFYTDGRVELTLTDIIEKGEFEGALKPPSLEGGGCQQSRHLSHQGHDHHVDDGPEPRSV